MSERTPNEAYFRSRRALVVSSGLLALSILSGIVPNDTDGSLTFFSVTLRSPENIPLIFLIITIYLVWQLWSAWLVQTDPVRRSKINRVDVFLSFLISIGAIAIWCWPFLLKAVDILSGDRWSSISTTFAAGVVGAALSNAISYCLLRASTWARASMIAQKIAGMTLRDVDRSAITSELLTANKWILIFDPESGRSKKISFMPDGAIGAGRNKNEDSWKIVDGDLEITNNKREVFSRFRYDNRLDALVHTDDPDTLSIRGQVIALAPA